MEVLRTCIACRQMKDKKLLIRVVKNQDGEIFIDKTGKTNGRGAYVCNSAECFKKLEKSRGLNRAFKGEVSAEVYKKLGEQIGK